VQLDSALGDPATRLELGLGAALHPVLANLIGHLCPVNIDTSG